MLGIDTLPRAPIERLAVLRLDGDMYESTMDAFNALYDNNADLLLTGHDHLYERFGPQRPDGAPDAARGIREFVVGTGGVPLYKSARKGEEVEREPRFIQQVGVYAGANDGNERQATAGAGNAVAANASGVTSAAFNVQGEGAQHFSITVPTSFSMTAGTKGARVEEFSQDLAMQNHAAPLYVFKKLAAGRRTRRQGPTPPPAAPNTPPAGASLGNAFYTTRDYDDGAPAMIAMYLTSFGGTWADGSLASDVILHEYAHGVTGRVTAGGHLVKAVVDGEADIALQQMPVVEKLGAALAAKVRGPCQIAGMRAMKRPMALRGTANAICQKCGINPMGMANAANTRQRAVGCACSKIGKRDAGAVHQSCPVTR